MPARKKIFISHISEETELAQLLKKHIDEDFLQMFDIFVSSDYKTIEAGKDWLDEIIMALEKAKLEIILCSKESVKRPWVNFEAGAGWVRGIRVIPVCHSGLSPADLPAPLNFLQVVEVSKEASLQSLYNALAGIAGTQTPKIDLQLLSDEIKEAEGKIKTRLVNTPGKYYHIVNCKTGSCLDVEALSKNNGAGIYLWPYHGGDNQLWQLTFLDESVCNIFSKNSRKCIQLRSDDGNNVTDLEQQVCIKKPPDDQMWEFTRLRDGTYKITSRQSGKCLSLDEDNAVVNDLLPIRLKQWGDKPGQRWWLKTSETPI